MADSAASVPSHVIDFLRDLLGSQAWSKVEIMEAKSAQQQVWILSHLQTTSAGQESLTQEWQEALTLGSNHLVIRQWKASSCWWNLNRNQQNNSHRSAVESLELLAKSEVAGYRIARQALFTKIHIPAVLHFSHDNRLPKKKDSETNPWAIFSYVGPNCTLFHETWMHDETWMDGMVKSRFEFGFEEPHPRWGRVPEHQCLGYALSVLHQVVIPLHQYMRDHRPWIAPFTDSLRSSPSVATTTNDWEEEGITYKSMVDVYQKELECKPASSNNPQLKEAVHTLGKAIQWLKQQDLYLQKPTELFVLCHMDCQPQNLIFATTTTPAMPTRNKEPNTMIHAMSLPQVSSVLDWEEAAMADARFELLMLCRKVCANRDQAEQLWGAYKVGLPQAQLGSLAPWLALETVHSLTSLLLQSMDLLGGGRNPWESEPDLWGKIEREMCRLGLECGDFGVVDISQGFNDDCNT